ncbi:MAG: hypothetical protein R2684_09090 [Pyrinomonadaceae bacterium]
MIKVSLNSLESENQEQSEFAARAIALLEGIVNQEEFKRGVLDARFSYRQFRTDAGRYVTFDNAEIWVLISGGKELNQLPDYELDFNCRFRKTSRSAKKMGYVIPPKPLITTNTTWLKHLSPYDHLSLAAHWMHEWMHVSGFVHPDNDRILHSDVAYTIGRLTKSVGIDLIGGGRKSAEIESLGMGYEESVESERCQDGPDEEFMEME